MSELIFESSLSIEEIEANFAEINFFDNIIESLNEVLIYEKNRDKRRPLAKGFQI